MPTALLDLPQARVRLHADRLEVTRVDEPGATPRLLERIPLRDLERVLATEHVQFTAEAIGALLREGIPLQWVTGAGRCLGGFAPSPKPAGATRMRQYERSRDGAWRLALSQQIIAAKLANQRRVLQRLASNRHQAPAQAVGFLGSLSGEVSRSRTLDVLQGVEGIAAARYFPAWAGGLPAEFPFERRSTRPPHNPVNAVLSFGYCLVTEELTGWAHAHGLDPSLGCLHAVEDGRWSLSLDLVEPFRPAVVDALTLHLFSHRLLNKDHFSPVDGGIHLNAAGRREFFLQWERRLNSEFWHPGIQHRTTLRRALRQSVLDFKAALERPEAFVPFRLP